MVDWATSEHYEEIRELQTNSIALQGSLKETETALGKVTLSLDSELPASFSFVQKSDKMSERQAEPITESATAEQWPVRNLCACDPHSVSSSSSSIRS